MSETANQNKILQYQVDDHGVALVTIDMKEHPANLFSQDFFEEYFKTIDAGLEDEQVKGFVITSSRRMFMAGGDLRILGKPLDDPEAFLQGLLKIHAKLRSYETAGKPFVAAINGTALGGGLELALTCHHRIALNHPGIKIGLPESKVGLLPGGGGTAKLPYLTGIQNGLMYIMQGIEARPEKALKDGIVHALVDKTEELIPTAKKWILENPKPVQPWDDRKYRIPGGGLMTPNGAQTLIGAIGNTRKMTHGNYPAQQFILSVVYEGLQMPIDRALEVEARYFTKVLQTPESRNMIRTGFFAIQESSKGKAKPAGFEPYIVKKLGVLGAGMMGAGIAYVSAKAGMEVILKDVSQEGAEKGKAYSQKVQEKLIQKGHSTPEKAAKLLANIHPTDDPAAVAGCDLVIEAVFENKALKAKVTHETEAVLAPDKVYASNTSTIPISQLAEASQRPENFIGIHFFSPVDRMPLVEIIVGKSTSDRTIAAAIDYVTVIKKVPILVNDKRGFYTSRVFTTYTSEAIFMLEEGAPAAMIENIAKNKGMAVGPLAVMDEVSLTLSIQIAGSNPDLEKNPELMRMIRLQKLIAEEHGRGGKKFGKGFYDYPPGEKKKLWPGLSQLFHSDPNKMDRETIAKRLLHLQALEAYRCLEEGVLRSAKDGDIGSVLGWGFPIYTGGALSYIDYIGSKQFVKDCDAFAAQYGDRWKVPDSLRNREETYSGIVFRLSKNPA